MALENNSNNIENMSHDDQHEILNPEDLEPKLKAEAEYRNLPVEVKRRVRALKKLQLENLKMESEFFKEVNALEVKYAEKFRHGLEKRRAIVEGKTEPTEDECDFKSDAESDDEADLADDLKQKAAITDGDTEKAEQNGTDDSPATGIPNFWLKVLQNNEVTGQSMIQPCDVPIFEKMTDLQCHLKKTEVDGKDQYGFLLEFHFAPNDYFHNETLTKEYFMNMDVPEEDCFNYEGPEICRTVGCPINWKQGKNVTVKTIKKVQKNKNRGEKRTVTKIVKADSFFNFFDPPLQELDDSEEDLDEDTEQLLEADFEIGNFLRERAVPRAVLYYTGEAMEEDEIIEEDLDDYEDDDDDLNEDGDVAGSKPNRKHSGDSKSKAADPNECKQQ